LITDMFTDLVVLFEQHPAAYLASIFALGLCVGSFLNVVIYRLPIMMQKEWRHDCLEFLEHAPDAKKESFNLILPKSRCGNCGHAIRAFENIPILSYLLLRGKCAGCKTPISIQYPGVELFTALVSLLVGWHFGVRW